MNVSVDATHAVEEVQKTLTALVSEVLPLFRDKGYREGFAEGYERGRAEARAELGIPGTPTGEARISHLRVVR